MEPDPSITPFVGTWDAEVLDFYPNGDHVNPPVDVLDLPASFFIVIEPSGAYTATLNLPTAPGIEQGQLTVIGSSIRLDPSVPPGDPVTSSYSFPSPDLLVLDGETEFSFNSVPISGDVHFELRRR